MTTPQAKAITTVARPSSKDDIEAIIESAVERAVGRILAGHLIRLAISEAPRAAASGEPDARSTATDVASHGDAPAVSAGSQAVSVPEAARILGISRSHAYEMIQLDRLCGVHLGRRIVVPVRSIEEMLQARVSRNDRRGELLVARQRPDELSSRPTKRTLLD